MSRKEIGNLLVYSRIVEEQYHAAQRAEIWVAALVLGCGLAESLLLMRAITSIAQIRMVPNYAGLSVEKLCSPQWGLRKLSELAIEMHWLNFKQMNSELVGALIKRIDAEIPIPDSKRESLEQIAPVLLMHIVRNTRNTIHAGKVASGLHGIERNRFLEEADENCAILNQVLACLRDTQIESSVSKGD